MDQFYTKVFSLSKINNAFGISIKFELAKNWQVYNSRRRSRPAGLQLAIFWAQQESGCSFKVSLFTKFIASCARKANLVPFSTKKTPNFEKFSRNFSQKTRIEQFNNPPLYFEIKSVTPQLTTLIYFSKIDENFVKIDENLVKKVNKNRAEIRLVITKL